MRTVGLGPSPPVLQAAIGVGWLNDSGLNRRMGWGKGDEGRLAARKHLELVVGNGFHGVYRGQEPVGWVTYEKDRETIRLELFFPKKHLGKGYGVAILEQLLDEAFRKDVPRVEIEVVEGNVPARKFLKHMGWHPESQRWSRVWCDGRWLDTFPYSMTPKRWKQKRREK